MKHIYQVVLVSFSIFPVIVSGKTFYLDDQLSGTCIGTYSIANRNNEGSDGDGYSSLQDAMDALTGGDTLIIREGSYSRSGFDPREPHEIGALDVGWNHSCDGTPAKHTVVMAYSGEQPVILAEEGKDNYNPDPGDHSNENSAGYYSNPAIGIHGEYIDVRGLKTYGMVTITYASHILIEGCDLGGGGPRNGQGNVIALDYGSYDITIRNNRIHNSCWGENDFNGAALIAYSSSALVEYNEFYDNWGVDIYVKDTGEQEGRIFEIRNNFFGPSSIYESCTGVTGHNQQWEVDALKVHNNIFYEKGVGVQWGSVDVPDLPMEPYNNTFVNCSITDIDAWGMEHELRSFNNLIYHDNGQKNFYFAYQVEDSDWNLFYSTTGEAVWNLNNVFSSKLNEWQTLVDQDHNSVYKDPLFVNATGTRPEDFKRTDYSGDVTGSSYGTVCGAYETGNEIIGLLSDDVQPAGIETTPSENNGLYIGESYPNPFHEVVNIPCFVPEKIPGIFWVISDVNGRVIKSKDQIIKGQGVISIDTSELKPGVYWFSLYAGSKPAVSQIMVKVK